MVPWEERSIDAATSGDSTEGGGLERLINRQSELFEDLNRLDGWDFPRNIDKVLTTLGFSETSHLLHRRIVRRLANPGGLGQNPA